MSSDSDSDKEEKPNSTTSDNDSDKEEKPKSVASDNDLSEEENSPSSTKETKSLTAAQENMIDLLVHFQNECESISKEDCMKVAPFPLGNSVEECRNRFKHITELATLTIHLIVEFSRQIPGFTTLLREDQITILKASSAEIMMLRTARNYNMEMDSVIFSNNQPYTRENFRSVCLGDFVDCVFEFCRNIHALELNSEEYAILTAIITFSERPELIELKKVEKIQETYIAILQAYINDHRPPGQNIFARILSILTELRTLGNMNSEHCFSLKFHYGQKFTCLLEELWDL